MILPIHLCGLIYKIQNICVVLKTKHDENHQWILPTITCQVPPNFSSNYSFKNKAASLKYFQSYLNIISIFNEIIC